MKNINDPMKIYLDSDIERVESILLEHDLEESLSIRVGVQWRLRQKQLAVLKHRMILYLYIKMEKN